MQRNILKTLTVLLTALLPLMAGCTSDMEGNDVEVKGKDVNPVGKIEVPVTPGVVELTDSQRQMVAQGNDFSFRLLQTVNKEKKGSYVFSPISVGYVLGMVNNAADERSRKEIMQVLGFNDATPQAVNDYFGNLLVNAPGLDENVTLEVANAIFGNSALGIQFADNFTALMQGYYQAGIESLDFNDAVTALGRINGWSNEKTHGMIPEILTKIDPYAVTYLLNAVYFNAPWTSPFSEKTQMESFYAADGTKQLPMMYTEEDLDYVERDGIKMISKPYAGGKFRMAVLLPASGGPADGLVGKLTTKYWQQLLESMSEETVIISMPTFNNETELNLIPVMKAMGMTYTFDSGDFSAMLANAREKARLGLLKQKAAIEVSQEGTKAAAVTIGGECFSANISTLHQKKYFHANSPFVYVLYEQTTGAIFFMGKFTGE